jgi:hypothetical protein
MSETNTNMRARRSLWWVLALLWKLPLCGLAFFVGLMLSGLVLPALGLEAPASPEGTDANTIALWFLAGSMLLGLGLAFLAQQLSGGWVSRWLRLGWLAFVCGAVSVVLDALLFMQTGATLSTSSLVITMLNFVLPFFFLAAAAAALFSPAVGGMKRKETGWGHAWLWKLGAAVLAYPVIYIVFGKLVEPLVRDYYLQGQLELTAPGWGQILPIQALRSLLFLLACLPVLSAWKGSSRGLAAALGLAITLLVGFMPVITSYWFPWQLRVFHGLEIMADSFVYAGVLAWLFLAHPRLDVEASRQPV